MLEHVESIERDISTAAAHMETRYRPETVRTPVLKRASISRV